ncbi:pyridoxamine 5'-phosphate oxidase [Motilibacter rhizosphaerae]|uniref:Pyridoxamine 5'-phosphate oxidase n=1 Tax=Motilibacter rhizosphaerae TaxID=598652 RepID=A0A4Q7NFW7_9ACTN|nr:pyridoxamine 5'-phosphate oxidase family protein [Motilibacter rhizosphaerae]RZS82689.1 pyridoxamine 5'-phosphate oxidase [Motilibacter rhizosphaerae]
MSSGLSGYDLHDDGAPPVDPLELAREWLPPDDSPERPRVTLATVGDDGCPDARTVLLSAFDESGFAFHTSASSRKVAQLAAVPHAAMVVLWPDFRRQLVVRGPVVPDGVASAARAWAARPDYLRRLAWLNDDALAVQPSQERRRRWAEFVPEHSDPAESWTGFRLTPVELTYWSAAEDTASRRLRYRCGTSGWTWSHLPG